MKNILHISDFHLSSNNRYGYPVDKIEILLSALKQDLNSTYNNDVDAVFFTGDMSFSGKKDEFEILEKKFILPLLEHLNLTATEFYMVPGNHDVSRDKVNRVYAEYRASATRLPF
jgi:predicted MPP superfamily phosphohydrolase